MMTLADSAALPVEDQSFYNPFNSDLMFDHIETIDPALLEIQPDLRYNRPDHANTPLVGEQPFSHNTSCELIPTLQVADDANALPIVPCVSGSSRGEPTEKWQELAESVSRSCEQMQNIVRKVLMRLDPDVSLPQPPASSMPSQGSVQLLSNSLADDVAVSRDLFSPLASGNHLEAGCNATLSDEQSDGPNSDEEYECTALSSEVKNKLDNLVLRTKGFYLTQPLSRRQRGLVHSFAHAKELSHILVDHGNDSRALVSVHPIIQVESGRKPYNFTPTAGDSPWLKPNCIGIANFCITEWAPNPRHAIREYLGENCLPFPIAMDLGDQYVFLTFADSGSAASVIAALESDAFPKCRPAYVLAMLPSLAPEDSSLLQVGKFHLGDSDGLNSDQSLLDEVVEGGKGYRSAGHSIKVTPTKLRRVSTMNSDTERQPSMPELYSSADSLTSSASGNSSDTNDGSTPRKRRKREPRIKDWYSCVEPSCGKTFDTAGALSKHEKVHKPRDQHPHRCDKCQKTFVYPKDLKRHQLTGSHAEQQWQESVMVELTRTTAAGKQPQHTSSVIARFSCVHGRY